MKLKWAILWWLIARCIFIGLPDDNADLFLFSDDPMPISSWGWVNIEMAFIAWLSWQWYKEKRRIESGILTIIMVFDWIHFVLSGNSFYFKVGIPDYYEYPMTNNVLMLLFWAFFGLRDRKDII
jgi:hypothetical protein